MANINDKVNELAKALKEDSQVVAYREATEK